MIYKIMLICGKEELTLAFNPEEIEITQPGTNETQDIINLGKVNVWGRKGLQEFELDGLYCADVIGRKAIDTAVILQRFQASGSPIEMYTNSPIRRFINAGGASLWLIESLGVKEKAGEENTFYLSAKFKQYRNYAVKSYTVAKGTPVTQSKPNTNTTLRPATPGRLDTRPAPTTYQVIGGDSLWVIAQKLLGKGDRWREIYDLNKNIISSPGLIRPGQKLKIPNK